MTTVTIKPATQDLYLQYDRMTGPQPNYITLDLETGEVWAAPDPIIGSGMPEPVWNNRWLRFEVPCLQAKSVNALMKRIEEDLQTILNDSEIVWNGTNHVGRLGKIARLHADVLTEMLQQEEGDLCVWDADDWMEPVTGQVIYQIKSGQSIDSLVAEYGGDGSSDDQPIVIGLREYLERLAAEHSTREVQR